MPLLRKSFFILLYLSFLVCFSLQTLNRNSRINFSSSGIPICFVQTHTLTVKSQPYFHFQRNVILCMYRLYWTKDWPTWPHSIPERKSVRYIQVFFFSFFWDFAIHAELHVRLLQIISITASKFYPQEYKYTACNRKLFSFVFNCTVSFVFCCPLQIKVCVTRGSVMKGGVFDSSTWVCASQKKNTP
jgi:hypothetical protein